MRTAVRSHERESWNPILIEGQTDYLAVDTLGYHRSSELRKWDAIDERETKLSSDWLFEGKHAHNIDCKSAQ